MLRRFVRLTAERAKLFGTWGRGTGVLEPPKSVPFSRTEEKLQEYWELDAITRFRKRHKAESDGDLG